MTSTAPSPRRDAERSDPPFPIVHVEEMLRLVVKATRAHQLYMQNNPMYTRAIELARGSFQAIWHNTGTLSLQVRETDLVWEGRPVLSEPDKSGDSLPWLLYKDGVRELELLRGFEDELVSFLEIVQRARRASPDEDDLLTLFWERDFATLRYRYVDLASDGVAPLMGGAGHVPGAPTRSPAEDVAAAAAEAGGDADAAQPAGIVNLEDFDATLYFLDETEISYLRDEVAREYATDLRQNVVSILFDIFEQQSDHAVREEVCDILDSLVLHLLSAREFRAVAYLLREAGAAAGRAQSLDAAHRERLRALPERLSSPAAVSQLVQSLDEASVLVPQEDLVELFGQLRPSALGTALGWLGKVQEARLRGLLETAVERIIASNTGELVALIGSADRQVALEAARRAAALRSAAAVAPLARLLVDGDAQLRGAAVMALADIGSAGALQALERAVEDTDRDVRVAAARAVAVRGYRPALARVEGVVKGKAIREADLTEKMAFFEAFGALCGDGGVALLDSVLNGKSLLGRRDEADVRACAAMALGRVGTPSALEALQRASGDKEALVRNAVAKAVRGATA